MWTRKKRLGFNAIELAVVVLLVFVVLSLVLVIVKSQREKAVLQAGSRYNLGQLALAVHSCNDVYKRMPPAFDKFGKMPFPVSVHVHLLPYIEQEKLYDVILQSIGTQGTEEIVRPFLVSWDYSRSDLTGVQNCAANLRIFSDKGIDTKFDADMPALGPIEPGNPAIPRTFIDGTSNTIIFATKLAACGEGGSRYAAAPDSPFAAYFGQNAAKVKAHRSAANATFQLYDCKCLTTPLMAQSFMENGFLAVVTADGWARGINPSVTPRTWNQLVQPNDEMTPQDDWQ